MRTRHMLQTLAAVTVLLLAGAVHAQPARRGTRPVRGTPATSIDFFDQTFDRDTVIDRATCTFRSGANIRVANGARLSIRCGTIVIEGQATIDGRGASGAPGSPGRDNGGWWTSTNHCGRNQGHKDWENAGKAHLPNEIGGNGGAGSPGGAGATILISYTRRLTGDVTNLRVDVSGGPGGPGGPGGKGMTLECGCHPGETKPADSGDAGSPGGAGPAGSYSGPVRVRR